MISLAPPRTARRGLVLGLVLALAPAAYGQSALCQNLNNTVRTCEDGFTCAYSFGGGDLYERFTFRTIASGNPNGNTSVIVFFSGEPRTVRMGTTEEGAVSGWVKRGKGEGDSFYRVDNTNSSGDITTRFSCAQAATETTEPSDVDDVTIEVEDLSLFAVGDSVIVAPGDPTEERRVVIAFGSLVLDRPLEFAHAAGETVVSIGLGPTATAGEEAPGSAAFQVQSQPNPASGATHITLTLAAPEAVTVEVVDARGRRLALLHDGPLAAGTHMLPFETADLPAGVYVVRARGESGVVSRRVTVVR